MEETEDVFVPWDGPTIFEVISTAPDFLKTEDKMSQIRVLLSSWTLSSLSGAPA
jgi:hypothetical protein